MGRMPEGWQHSFHRLEKSSDYAKATFFGQQAQLNCLYGLKLLFQERALAKC